MADRASALTGRDYLRERQYATDANLAARQSIYRFQDPQPESSLFEWALGLGGFAPTARIVDVGCGNGNYLRTLSDGGHGGPLVGLDLSEGMAVAARGRAPAAHVGVADAAALPFADATFDGVLAMHMLYHLPDQRAGAGELRRVLRPGGTALLVTNTATHLREMDELLGAAINRITGEASDAIARAMALFSVDNGEPVLRSAFDDVEVVRRDGRLVVTEVAPVIAYARSMGSFITGDPEVMEAALVAAEQMVAQRIADEGAFTVHIGVGCFVCR